jgi:hypothetical protein
MFLLLIQPIRCFRSLVQLFQKNQKIVNAIVKNCKNGEWKTRNLKPEDCKVGDVVLDFNKSICEIKEVKHNSNERGFLFLILLLQLICC